MNNILIVTDTFEQVNGVSTTYKNMIAEYDGKITVAHPALWSYTTSKLYPEVQICYQPFRAYKFFEMIKPCHVHIATEGVLGLTARIYCKLWNVPYTTAYHTKFPEFLYELAKIPKWLTYSYLRWFHKKSKAILVPTVSCMEELKNRGFNNLRLWTRGVSQEMISEKVPTSSDKIRLLNVGRVSKEKNLDELCKLADKYDVTIVGDGPYLEELKSKYPNVTYLGYKFGKELADIYATHDVFVFPSKTDTFGIVIIEALCNGTPVAAYNVTGPKDILQDGLTGSMCDDLEQSIQICAMLNRDNIKKASTKWSWKECLDTFLDALR